MSEADDTIKSLVTDGLMAAFYRGIDYYEHDDLVLIYDLGTDALLTFERDDIEEGLRKALMAEPTIAEMISIPAREAEGALKGMPSFWFLTLLEDERVACCVVSGGPIAPGGDA